MRLCTSYLMGGCLSEHRGFEPWEKSPQPDSLVWYSPEKWCPRVGRNTRLCSLESLLHLLLSAQSGTPLSVRKLQDGAPIGVGEGGVRYLMHGQRQAGKQKWEITCLPEAESCPAWQCPLLLQPPLVLRLQSDTPPQSYCWSRTRSGQLSQPAEQKQGSWTHELAVSASIYTLSGQVIIQISFKCI